MHEFSEKLKEYPAKSRLKVITSDRDSAEAAATQDGPQFLKLVPSYHRQGVSHVLGHPFSDIEPDMDVAPPEAMAVTGPYPVLMGIPAEDRAAYIFRHMADFEDIIREVPETLLLLPEDDRDEIADALDVELPDSGEEAPDAGEQASDTGDARFEKSAAGVLDLAVLLRMLDQSLAVMKELKSDGSWISYQGEVPVYLVNYTGVNGEEVEGLFDAIPTQKEHWDGKPCYTRSGDTLVLHLYKERTDEKVSIPLSEIHSITVIAEGPAGEDGLPTTNEYKVSLEGLPVHAVETKPQRPSKEPAPKRNPSGLTADDIYRALSQDAGGSPAVGVLKLSYPKREVTVSRYPSWMKDDHGNTHKFGTGPEGAVRVMQYPDMRIVDIQLSNILEASFGKPLETLLRDGLDQLATKYPDDVEYIKKYNRAISDLKKDLASKVIAVVDTESVGLLDKARRDSSGMDANRSVSQLLQVSGMQIVERGGKFVENGEIFDERVRLLPHNLAVLEKESMEGFDHRIGDRAGSTPIMGEGVRHGQKLSPMEDHTDILHWGLQYTHRPYLPKNSAPGSNADNHMAVDILGVPRQQSYMKARGKGALKPIAIPDRLSGLEYERAQEIEAAFKKEREVLREFLEWLTGVSVVCGHNVYAFDRRFLQSRLVHNKEAVLDKGSGALKGLLADVDKDLFALSKVPHMDTLHLVKILFLPAVGIIAFSPLPDLPESMQKEAKDIATKLKSNVKLETLAEALGVNLSGAHDSLNDVRANVEVFRVMLDKLTAWEQFLVGHQMYERHRAAQMVEVAKMFNNRKRGV
jgi:DNA polymerase III epsilon subunit-like protein